MGKLTDKQKKFVNEYLIDLNATQAAIRAGYSVKTADVQAARLLGNVKVQAYLQDKQKKREERTEITQDRVLKELASVAFANGTDFAKLDVESDQIKIKFVPTALLPADKKAAIAGIKETQVGIEIKLNDKMKALELLGKHLGMFKDNEANRTQDNGLNTAIEKSAKEVWTDEIRDNKPQADESLDMVGSSTDCEQI